MADYSITQCLAMNLPKEVKEYLTKLANSPLPNAKEKVFTAANQTQLKQLLQVEFDKYNKGKLKRENIKKCHDIIDSLVKGVDGNRRLISAEELLPKLEELKLQIEQERKFDKIDKMISNTGMSNQELIEYLKSKDSIKSKSRKDATTKLSLKEEFEEAAK